MTSIVQLWEKHFGKKVVVPLSGSEAFFEELTQRMVEEDILKDFASVEMRKNSGEVCQQCGRQLCVGELLTERCYRGGTIPSKTGGTPF